MKKIIIPTILAATIMIAGIFAFMPVEQATSVHITSIGAAVVSCDTVTSTTAGAGTETFDIDSSLGGDFYVSSILVETADIDNVLDDLSIAATGFSWDDAAAVADVENAGGVDVQADLLGRTGLLMGTGSTGAALTLTMTEDNDGSVFSYTLIVCGSTGDGGTIDIAET